VEQRTQQRAGHPVAPQKPCLRHGRMVGLCSTTRLLPTQRLHQGRALGNGCQTLEDELSDQWAVNSHWPSRWTPVAGCSVTRPVQAARLVEPTEGGRPGPERPGTWICGKPGPGVGQGARGRHFFWVGGRVVTNAPREVPVNPKYTYETVASARATVRPHAAPVAVARGRRRPGLTTPLLVTASRPGQGPNLLPRHRAIKHAKTLPRAGAIRETSSGDHPTTSETHRDDKAQAFQSRTARSTS